MYWVRIISLYQLLRMKSLRNFMEIEKFSHSNNNNKQTESILNS